MAVQKQKKNFGPRTGRGLCDVGERQSPVWEGEEERIRDEETTVLTA